MGQQVILVSACLLGVPCRYDGKSKAKAEVLALQRERVLIPVCPEQLGGLPTPREPSERLGEAVVTKGGADVTAQFSRGAAQALHLARLFGCKKAILKARSPSCGSGTVYDGSFSGRLTDGDGVTAALLKANGITIYSEEDLDQLLAEETDAEAGFL